MKIKFYGELDPYTGSVPQSLERLPALVRELGLLMLLNDVVVVPPGDLLSHALALPAFEALADFVRAGRLTTTAATTATSPRSFFEARIDAHREALEQKPRKGSPIAPRPTPLTRHRRASFAELRHRWGELLPERFPLHRDEGAQIRWFSEALRRFCAETSRPTLATRRLLRVLEQGGPEPRRSAVLAHLAAYRVDVAPRDLARLLLVVQTAYFHGGVLGHETHAEGERRCQLFPGRFASILRDRASDLEGIGLPAFDWSNRPAELVSRLLRKTCENKAVLLGLAAEPLRPAGFTVI